MAGERKALRTKALRVLERLGRDSSAWGPENVVTMTENPFGDGGGAACQHKLAAAAAFVYSWATSVAANAREREDAGAQSGRVCEDDGQNDAKASREAGGGRETPGADADDAWVSADWQDHQDDGGTSRKVEGAGTCAAKHGQVVYDVLSAVSLAWQIFTSLPGGGGGGFGDDPEVDIRGWVYQDIYGIRFDDVMREYQRWIGVYCECVGVERSRQLEQLVPVVMYTHVHVCVNVCGW